MSNLPPSEEGVTWCLSMMQRLKNWQNKPSLAENHREGNDASRRRHFLKEDGYLIFIVELGRFAFEEGLFVFLLCGEKKWVVIFSHLPANVHCIFVLRLSSMYGTLCWPDIEG